MGVVNICVDADTRRGWLIPWALVISLNIALLKIKYWGVHYCIVMEKVYDRELIFYSCHELWKLQCTKSVCLPHKRLYEFATHPPPDGKEVMRTSVWKAIQTNYYEQGNHSKNATLALDTVKPQTFLIYNLLIHVIKWLKPLNSAQYTF